jgi:poly(A) polymerase
MTPSGDKLIAPWLRDPRLVAVFNALSAESGQSRVVGGCVRNSLINEPVGDIDIATTHRPEAVVKMLEAAKLKAVPTGIEHGTITAISDSRGYEITTLRRDVSTDGRRAVIAYSDNWTEDANRRDFTMNAIYADLDGTLFDPTGGLTDLGARRVRFIGDAAQRIAEDYLRVLRFFRIHAWYGKGELDGDGLRASAAAKDQLKRLSAERIQKEMLRLVEAPYPVEVMRVMAATGILGEVLPGELAFDRFARLVEIERDQLFTSEPVLRLASLVTSADAARALAKAWRLSNGNAARIEEAHTATAKIVSYLSIREVRRLLYRLGPALFKDLVMLRWAEDARLSNAPQWRALLAFADSWQRPQLPLSGHDVMAAGVPPGPLVGKVMAEVEDWWVDTDFTDDKFSLIERLKAVVQATVL